MPRSNNVMIHKLQNAINEKGAGPILYNKTQFYSEQQKRPVNLYIIKKAVWNEKKHHNNYVELFSTTSQIQIVLFLRDYWYEVNGWPIPTDNKIWETAKEKYREKQEKKLQEQVKEE